MVYGLTSASGYARRVTAVAVGVIGLGAGGARATTPPEMPDPVAAFAGWAAANNLALTRIACSVEVETTCYGLDETLTPTAATMNADGTFTVVVPIAPAATAAVPQSGPSDTGVPWANYDELVRQRIAELAAAGDCAGLQAEFDAAYANDAHQRDRTGTGNAALMTYLDALLRAANCY